MFTIGKRPELEEMMKQITPNRPVERHPNNFLLLQNPLACQPPSAIYFCSSSIVGQLKLSIQIEMETHSDSQI